MPCRTDEPMQPTAVNYAAKLLMSLMIKLKLLVPTRVVVAVNNCDTQDKDIIPELCRLIGALTDLEQNEFIYNGRDPEC